MKIGILTYYNVHNHGAVLQANGLKKVLEAMGNEVEFLIFDRNYDYISTNQSKKYKLSFGSIFYYMGYMLERGIGNVIYNFRKRNTLNEYRARQFKLNTRYDVYNGEAVVIGSDEVFSLEIGYNPMLYGYGIKTPKIFSYAGCFGPTTVESVKKCGKEKDIACGLSQMNAISVRDYNSQRVVKKLTGIDATLVCDPVILYGYQQEMNVFVPSDNRYIVVYAYDGRMNDAEEVSEIKAYAKNNNLKIYSVGYHHKWCDKNIDASPEEVLGWIKNATLVVTDTFHGAVMSIICNTPMAVKLRGNQNKLAFLLQEYNLADRIIENFSQLETIADQIIDFGIVNSRIQERRTASLNFLKSVLTE